MRFKWRRLLVNPTTRIESREGDVTRLRIDGLVCYTVCAVRAKRALLALPGVRSVTVDYDAGVATIEGDSQAADAYERAVTGVVGGKPLRRFIEHVGGRFPAEVHASSSAVLSASEERLRRDGAAR